MDDKPTTSVKVHHAPGGASSFSLGWGGDEPAPPSKAKPIYGDVGGSGGAFGAPTGSSRSEMNIGPDGGERTSVKVHHAPGGASSLSISDGAPGSMGGYEAPAPKVGIFAAPEAPPPTGSGKFGGAPAAGEGTGVPTSVKVHNPPGGKSQITFG